MPDYLITLRVVDDPNLGGDRVKRSCFKCLSSVWIGPESPYWSLRYDELKVVCTHCAPKIEGLDQAESVPLTEEQRLTIARTTGLWGNQIDRGVERLTRKIFGSPDLE